MRGRSGRLPAWYKGQLILDDVDGFWYGHREGKLLKQRGLRVSRENFDSITDKQREDMVQARLNRPPKPSDARTFT